MFTARVVVGLVLVSVSLLFARPGAAVPPAKPKILLIGTKPDHPYRSHMYMFECQLLARCLRENMDVEPVVSENWPADPRLFDGVRSIVFYSRPAGAIVLAAPNRARFQQLMDSGVGYVAIHWATGVGYSMQPQDQPQRQAYLNVLGGWFRRPPGGISITTARLVQTDPQHPICRGWTSREVHDEFYLDPVLHEKAHPILQVNVEGKDQEVGWIFERPDSHGGRSFGTTLGHFHENFTRAAFRRLLVNGILWTAHLSVPKTGAAVAVDPAALRLPPRPK